MKIIGVPSDTLPEIWVAVAPYFQDFAERGGTTSAELLASVLKKERQCWIAWDGEVRAVALTQLSAGTRTEVELTHCGGAEREEWQDALVKEIEAWGKSVGAVWFRAICRPGWTPFLKEHGFRETHRVLEREIG